MARENRKNILILDPEKDTAELFSRALENHGEGFTCYWVTEPDEARRLMSEISFTFVLADVSILQDDRFLLLASVTGRSCAPRVIANGHGNEKTAIKTALEKGAAGYFIKPVMVCTLRKLIDDFSTP
ncbi:MAG: response regulator [Syntrophobacteraceae bacterium]|nr:response regulator [Syntrophobacteraceae bacterium]